MLFPARSLKPLFVLLILLVVVCVPAVVSAINLNGIWSYRESGSDSGDTFRELRQNYSLGVGPTLTYKPSHALTVNASVGYTQTNQVDGQEERAGRTITPTAGFTLTNDIFSARFFGNTTSSRSDGGDGSNSTNWDATLTSQWDELYVPKLFFSYGEFGDSQGAGIVSPKTQSKDLGVGVDWDLYRAEISYYYRQARFEDLPTTQSHFVKLKTAGRFWDNRIAFTLSQQVQFESQEIDGGALAGGADVPVGSQVRTAISPTDTPIEYSDDVNRIPRRDWLRSAPFPSSRLPYSASEQVLIAIDPPTTRRIGAVEISFNAVLDPGVGSSNWDLYEYRPSSDDWELIEANITKTQEFDDGTIRRLRFEIPEADREFDREFLLASDRPSSRGGSAGEIINVEVFEIFSGSGRMIQSYQTNAGVQMRFSETLSSSLGLTYTGDKLETDGGGADDIDTDRVTTSANISWRPFPFLTASLGGSDYRELKLGEEQRLNRNYTLIVNTAPLPTMNVSFGAQLDERYGVILESGAADIDQKTLETLRYSISGKAQIYPDLSASFNMSYTEGHRWLKDEGADTGRFVDATGQDGRLDLNAKLYKNLTADLITRYFRSVNEGIGVEAGSAELGLRFRLSELLLVRGSYRTGFIGEGGPDSLSLRVQTRLLDTDKTRLEAEFSHTQAEVVVETISINGSWRASKNISLIGRGGYNFGEVNSYDLTLDLLIGI
jgi:hypothetical protein